MRQENIVESCFLQTERSAEDINMKNCVQLDSESSAHTFCNDDVLEATWSGPDKLVLRGNGGDMTTYLRGSIRNLPMEHPIWYRLTS